MDITMPVPHVLDTEIHIERNLTITMCLDIIHLFFYLKHNISETGFSLRLQVNVLSWAQSIQLVPIVWKVSVLCKLNCISCELSEVL